MRMSDWSSDVCFSDLDEEPRRHTGAVQVLARGLHAALDACDGVDEHHARLHRGCGGDDFALEVWKAGGIKDMEAVAAPVEGDDGGRDRVAVRAEERSVG